jgi:hypothetical protein
MATILKLFSSTRSTAGTKELLEAIEKSKQKIIDDTDSSSPLTSETTGTPIIPTDEESETEIISASELLSRSNSTSKPRFKSIIHRPKDASNSSPKLALAPIPSIDYATLEYKTIIYEVEGVGKYEYTGMVDMNGLKCGRGALKYPNGNMYEGDFMFGKRHGLGTLIFSTDKKSQRLAIGQWKNDMPSEDLPWKITYDTWEYFGNITVNKGDGKTKKNYELLNFEDLLKNEQGELSDKKSEFKYFGYFKDNKKEGFGVATFKNGDQYYGGWRDDYLSDFGTYVYKDGTIFQGLFRRGTRKGKGTLYMPSGDIIEGKWSGDKIKDAIWKKGETKDCHITMLNQMLNEITETLRMNSNVGYLVNKNEDGTGLESNESGPPTSQKWHTYYTLNAQAWIRESDIMLSKLIINNARKSEGKEKNYILNDMEDVKRLLDVLFNGTLERDTNGFINGLVQFFIGAFQGKYNTSAYTSTQLRKKIGGLLSHAVDDVKSFIEYLSKLLLSFFTDALDRILETYLSNSGLRQVVDNINQGTDPSSKHNNGEDVQIQDKIIALSKLKDDIRVHGQTLVANHIHAKLYQTLFPLYEIMYQENDLLLNQKINSVPNVSPIAMGVDRKFIPQNEPIPFAKSIALLDKLPREKTVAGKIACLAILRDTMMFEVRHNRTQNRKLMFERQQKEYTDEEREEDENWQAGADDVTSVYSYVFVRSKIRNHLAQFHYINDWKDNETMMQPVVHLITFYEGFSTFVQDLDPNLKTEDGQLISSFVITKSLERGVERVSRINKNQSLSFYWLPTLLCHIGLEIGGLKINTSAQQVRQSIMRGEFTPFDNNMQFIDNSPTRYKSCMVIPKEQEILDMNGQNLKDTLIEHLEIVKQVLTLANPNIGFMVKLEYEKDENGDNLPPSVVIEFDRVYPSHVYSELSLQLSKFVRFELDYLLD